MRATRAVQKILSNYEGTTPGVKANLCRMLMNGKLGGTGKMIILPVDQGLNTVQHVHLPQTQQHMIHNTTTSWQLMLA
ncbi:fructose-bisphosphate aldolase [Rhodobacterales bacterium HTCC2150]|nr:fructose-bisphosphate aldolase [Rhodobacterales bacterium HTCC2150] [Rhodobacteraceae bacterium HTCC2150]